MMQATRKPVRSLWLVAACLGLAGCFDLEQSLTVEARTVRYEAELAVDAKLMALAQAGADQEPICDRLKQAGGNGLDVQVSQTERGGDVVCRLSVVGPLAAFGAMEWGSTAGREVPSALSIERLDDQTYRLTSRLGEGSARQDQYAQGLMAVMFSGRHFKWTVKAPRIVESNGTLSADGSTVTWSVPLATAMRSPQTFTAVIQIDIPWHQRLMMLAHRVLRMIKDLFGG